MQKFLKQKNKGFTLVETLVAISIFTVSILGLLMVLSQGIADTNYAKQKMIAAYLAQEGIEYIRNMRDTYVLYTEATGNDWNAFKVKLNPCNLGNECGFDNSIFPPDVFKCSTHSNQCKLYLDNGNYNTNSLGSDSGFVRKIWMETAGLGPDQVKISSKVEWTQGSGNYNIIFSENLFNWE
ncbi:MAG: prepilin-type N-terminal cleavage/methylation domain-containing protein [Patescibacteria group bacterium]